MQLIILLILQNIIFSLIKNDKALEILNSIGFTKKSIDSFIIVASTELEVDFSNDTRLLLKEKISKKYLN